LLSVRAVGRETRRAEKRDHRLDLRCAETVPLPAFSPAEPLRFIGFATVLGVRNLSRSKISRYQVISEPAVPVSGSQSATSDFYFQLPNSRAIRHRNPSSNLVRCSIIPASRITYRRSSSSKVHYAVTPGARALTPMARCCQTCVTPFSFLQHH
jgi:hypothetical protein